MKNFADRLIENIIEKESVSVVGLDPRIERIPKHIKENSKSLYGETTEAIGDAFLEFNKRIIDRVSNHVAVVKPQIAFYEQYGSLGIKAFEKTVNYAKKRKLIVIEDAKRSDISSTAKAYATGHLGEEGFDVDAITVGVYLGKDGILPFIEKCKEFNKGIFALVKTSNPSSQDLQDIKMDNGKKLYELSASLVEKLGQEIIGNSGYSSVGAVVGATYPKESKILRTLMKKSFFLVPGYGVQGGKAKDVLNCFNKDGLGAIINSSRGIIFAYQDLKFECKEEEFEKACEKAIIEMNKSLNGILKKNNRLPW